MRRPDGSGGLRFVMLDRDASHSLILSRELDLLGHSVERARDVAECAMIVRGRRCDVVLAGTSIFDGSSLALPLVLGDSRPLLVYMTTLPERPLARPALSMGFDAALTKSVSAKDLFRVRSLSRLSRDRMTPFRADNQQHAASNDGSTPGRVMRW